MSLNVIPWNGQPISEPGCYSDVPISEYHGANLCVRPSISSSGLRTIFTKSAMHFWMNSVYNPNAIKVPESRAFITGRALHHLALGEADFDKHFVVRPEKYPGDDGKLKAWTRAAGYCKDWEKANGPDMGRDVVTPDELDDIRGMCGLKPWQKGLEDCGLMNNELVKHGALQGIVECTLIGIDPETGTFLRARPDVIPTNSAEASDLKSTISIEPYKLQKTLNEYRYDAQGSLVSRCLEQACGIRLTNFSLIFVQKGEPHEVAVRELTPYDMDQSALDNQAAIRAFALGMETGRWPGIGGGEEDARFLERSTGSRDWANARRDQLNRTAFG